MDKSFNPFHFILKGFFVLKTYNFLFFFDHIGRRFDKKDKTNFKIYDVTNWITKNFNKHIVKYLKKLRQSGNEVWSVNRIQREK